MKKAKRRIALACAFCLLLGLAMPVKAAAASQVLIPKGETVISTNTVYGPDTVLRFEPGAVLTVQAGATLTVNGTIEAGQTQIFAGEGTVTGSPKNAYGYPQWFGAKGDGSTDDSAAVTKTAALFSRLRLPVTGSPYVIGEVELSRPVVLEGEALRTPVTASPGAESLFRITSGGVQISNLAVNMAPAANSSSVFLLDDTAAPISGVRLTGIYVDRAAHTVSNTGGTGVGDLLMKQLRVTNSRAPALLLDGAHGQITLQSAVLDHGQSSVIYQTLSMSFPVIHVKNSSGVAIESCVINGGVAGVTSGNHAIRLENVTDSLLRDCAAYYTGDAAYDLTDCEGVRMETLRAEICGGAALRLANSSGCQGDLLKFSYLTGSGIQLISSDKNQFSGVFAHGAGTGMTLTNSRYNLLLNAQFNVTGAYAYQETGSSDYNLAVAVSAWGSAKAAKQLGAHSRLSNLKVLTGSAWSFVPAAVGAYDQ